MLNGGHGHADALSLIVNVGGTEILTDPGTCVYNGSPEWRNFFRSTRAHNTVVVDDSDQSIPDGTFKWRRKTQSRVVQHLSKEAFDYVEAEHDGYRDAPHNIMHRRRLLHVRPDLWVVVDDLNGDLRGPSHMFDFYFHFPSSAKLSVQEESDSVLRANVYADSARLQLLMCTSAPIKAKPIEGWVSSLYGEKSPAPTLRIGMNSPAPASGIFIMRPSHASAHADDEVDTRPVHVTEGSALACEAEYGDVQDIFVSSLQDEPIAIRDFFLRGKFFWLRTTNGRLTQVLGIDCREIHHRDEILLCDEAGRSHFWGGDRSWPQLKAVV